jgi:hypothetical protein
MLILRGPRKNLELTHDAEGWKAFLADPEKQWKDGRSAKLLAEAWEAASPGLPPELSTAFAGTPFERFEPILAIPEYEVDLPGGGRPSQNDLFVVGRIDGECAIVMVEGKVDESFGPLLEEWLRDASPGKLRRLAYLQETLGLEEVPLSGLRYQLLHRTASPVIEATRLRARYAAMVVHSFSADGACHDDYETFVSLLGGTGATERVERIPSLDEPELWVGWVSGNGSAAKVSATIESTVHERPTSLPRIIAHADWGSDPSKQWMCVAELEGGGGYRIASPEPVGDPSTVLCRLRDRAQGETLAMGFDFPIGVPAAYAQRAGIRDFLDALPELGHDRWADFYTVASTPEDISLTRPFYPMRPGGTSQRHLTEALGVDDMSDLLRLCDRANGTRGAACPIFWTLGGKQVGKAALLGWREVLAPALRDEELDVSVWPFHGGFAELIGRGGIVIAETYPAEACLHVGLTPPGRGWSKRDQEGRRAQAPSLQAWARERPVDLDDEVRAQIADGFGPSRGAEDPFDAMLGLLSMVEVALGYREEGAPNTEVVRRVEGWILGQAGPTSGSLGQRSLAIGAD